MKNAIIFCNRKRDVATLHRSLLRHGFSVQALHGDMDQPARMAALEQFRKGEVTLLVASDVAARGLDIPDVSHIYNFDVPLHADDYVHRIGRTGRAGRSGTAITIVAGSNDAKAVAAIEKLIGQSIPYMGELPGAAAAPSAPAAAAPRRPAASPARTCRRPAATESSRRVRARESTTPGRFAPLRRHPPAKMTVMLRTCPHFCCVRCRSKRNAQLASDRSALRLFIALADALQPGLGVWHSCCQFFFARAHLFTGHSRLSPRFGCELAAVPHAAEK